jgi:methyl-accepting chemotaxis protein
VAQASRRSDDGSVPAGGSEQAAAERELTPPRAGGDDALARVRESLDLLEADLAVLIGNVREAAQRVHQGIASATQAQEAVSGATASLQNQVGTAESNVSAFATATEQLAQSSTLISGQIHRANDFAAEANTIASTTGKQIERLRTSSADISKVVTFISGIAKQTHLLALNASIEAARAGDAGKGFAVVAQEVKALSGETQQAITEITAKIEALRSDAEASMTMLGRIAGIIEQIKPLFATISSSAEQQVATTQELSINAQENSTFIGSVADQAKRINEATARMTKESVEIDHSANIAAELAETLRKRLSIFLRATEIGDRRMSDRLPCDWAVTVSAAGTKVKTVTVDMGEGGTLLKAVDGFNPHIGENIRLDIAGIGEVAAKVVNTTDLGIHCSFFDMPPPCREALNAKLGKIRAENKDFIETAITAANNIGEAIEHLIKSGKVPAPVMFDNRYVPIPNTNPQQYRTPYVEALEQALWPIQEPLLASDERMVFCAAVDRNAYLPVHNKKYSHPQRPGEVEWNTANCRNMRIFDDRAGLSAARNTRPYMIQYYPRVMGGGKVVMMWEIVAPIRVLGRHWGGFRVAYRT